MKNQQKNKEIYNEERAEKQQQYEAANKRMQLMLTIATKNGSRSLTLLVIAVQWGITIGE